MKKVWTTLGALCLTAPLCAKQPNILFIMADDLGCTDLGCVGSDFYETPNIDRLAAQGILFDNAYAPAANSAPSRACLMTGLYPPRHGIFTVSPPERGDATKRKLIPIPNKEDVAADFVTLDEALRQQGYVCGHIGKWHLGDDADGTGPLSQGFVSNVGGDRAGAPYSYFFPYKLPGSDRCHLGLEQGREGEYLTDRLTDEAIGFLRQHRDGPFFLYLAHYAVHTPLQAPADLVDKYKAKHPGKYHTNPIYAAMIERLDDGVGRLLATLDELGLADNTLVVFCSDNGGSEPVTDNAPYRGGKGTPYEGGIRVPVIMRWPGVFTPGTVSDAPICSIDFYPTFVRLAGGQAPCNLDGVDLFEQLDEKVPSRDLFWHFPAYLESYYGPEAGFRATPYSIVRSGGWKLIYYYEDRNIELFHLDDDPYETRNLADECPEKRDELYMKLVKWIEQTEAPMPSLANPLYVDIYND